MADSSPDPKPALSVVLAAYLQAVDTGANPDRNELLTAHPDLADDLRAFFVDHDKMTQAAGTVRNTLEATGAPLAETFPQGFGDYELLAEIGRGGMGVVYKARQVSLNRVVALKRIRAGQLASSEEVARFRREAEAAAGLDHPHIVPIYEVGEHAGQHYFTMKLIEGGNLNAHLARFADARATADVMIKIARAVQHAHQRGILHRDLKPGNILIDADGNPHVSDFGLAQPIEKEAKLTQSGAIVGTPEYMAPEQARGEKGLTTAADVYGLGAILYVLLTGKPPFQGDYNWETLKKVVEDEPISPRSLNRKANRDLERICLKCLEKEPKKRFQSAADLAEDLEHWLHGRPLRHVRAVSNFEKTYKWVKRHPVTMAFGLILLAVSGLLLRLRDQQLAAELADQRAAEQIAEEKLRAAKSEWRELLNKAVNFRLAGHRWEALTVLKTCADQLRLQPSLGDEDTLRHEAFLIINSAGTRLAPGLSSHGPEGHFKAVVFNLDESMAAVFDEHEPPRVSVIDLTQKHDPEWKKGRYTHRPPATPEEGDWTWYPNVWPFAVKWKSNKELELDYEYFFKPKETKMPTRLQCKYLWNPFKNEDRLLAKETLKEGAPLRSGHLFTSPDGQWQARDGMVWRTPIGAECGAKLPSHYQVVTSSADGRQVQTRYESPGPAGPQVVPASADSAWTSGGAVFARLRSTPWRLRAARSVRSQDCNSMFEVSRAEAACDYIKARLH